MRLDITARHMELTTPLRQLITNRVTRLERVLNDAAVSAIVIVTKEKYRHRTEMVVHTRDNRVLKGLGEGNAWPLSIRDAAERIEQQAKKLKGKWHERKRKRAGARGLGPALAEPAPAPARRVIRATRYAVKPMSVEDAALRVEAGPETFVVFRNADTEAVSIVYRRRDGNFGLIEPE